MSNHCTRDLDEEADLYASGHSGLRGLELQMLKRRVKQGATTDHVMTHIHGHNTKLFRSVIRVKED